MKKNIKGLLITFLLILIFQAKTSAQVSDSKILVRNAGVIEGKQIVSVKWYSIDLYYPEGVNLYRREEQGEWRKINIKPIRKLSDVAAIEYSKDKDLNFFIPLINKGKKEDLKGLFMINVLVKSFESEVFSKFLGIQYDDTVKAGTTYCYKVNKIKGASESLIGESIPITAGLESIEEPIKDAFVKADTAKVLMKWRPEDQRYFAVNIYRETTEQTWKKLNSNPVMISKSKDSLGRYQYPNNFFIDDSLNPGFYTYQFAGVDFFGKETKRSPSFKVEVKDLIPPPPPKDLEDSINNLKVMLTWKLPVSKDIMGVNVYRSIKSSGPFIKLNASLLSSSTISYIDIVGKPGPYYYYVTSSDAAFNESKSNSVFSEVHDINPPSKPIGFIAKADTGKVFLTWQKNKEGDLMGYRIFRTINKNDKNNFTLINTEPIKANTFTDKLPKNVKNKVLYKIIAIDSSYNKSEYSEVASIQMPDIIPPVKPLLKNISNAENTFIISWIPNKDADLKGYDLYKSKNKEKYFKVNTELIPLKKLNFTDRNIFPATNYFYYLVTVDSAGNTSQHSNILNGYNNFVTLSSVLSHVKVKYREEKKDIHISWKEVPSENILGYVIYKKQGENQQMVPLTGQLKKNEYSDKDIKAGSYYYEVRAFDKTGNIARSETVKITVQK